VRALEAPVLGVFAIRDRSIRAAMIDALESALTIAVPEVTRRDAVIQKARPPGREHRLIRADRRRSAAIRRVVALVDPVITPAGRGRYSMAHSQVIEDPESAIRALNRQRSVRLVLAIGALVAIVVGIAVGLSAAYSDAPEVKPGLQSQ
jgi:hypothetical protein